MNAACMDNTGKNIDALMAGKDYKPIVANLLEAAGLNYGALPKGLLKFHRYADGVRTPLEEHLVEGALYAAGRTGKVNVHFTVSTEHRELFTKLVEEKVAVYAKKYGVEYDVSFLNRNRVRIRLLPIWRTNLSAIKANCCSVREGTAR